MAKLKESELPEEAFYRSLDLQSEGVQRLMAYLVEEHRQALLAHEDYFAELKMLRRAITARPAVKVKTFPWPGASNLVAPIIRIAGDAVKARIVNTLLAPKPFWICSPTSSGNAFAAYAKPWENFLSAAAAVDFNLVDTIEQIADQVVYLGKCPVKLHWLEDIKKVRTYDRQSRKEVYLTRVIYDQPMIQPILLENWLEPWGIQESVSKPWNSHRIFLQVGELIERERQGLIKGAKDIAAKIGDKLPQDMIELGELRKQAWTETQALTFYETCVQFDIDEDGFREECIVLWNYDFSLPVSVKYNYFFHGHRPLDVFYYLRSSQDRSQGDGLAQLLWPLQEAISSFLNQRADNITIANTRYWKGKRNAGIKKGESVWPGKVFLLDDPAGDLIADKLGDVSPSSFSQETILRDYAERLSGISDPQLGREFDNPRVAATTTLSVLQEGNRRFDMIIRGMRATLSRVGMRVGQLYQQFGPRFELGAVLAPEDEVYVREILSMSPMDVEKNFAIQVNTSSAAVNKETQRQGLLALFNLTVQFYSQILQVAVQVMANPQIPDPIKDMIVEMAQKSYTTLKEIVATYDVSDADAFLVDVGQALEFVRQGGNPMSAMADMQAGMDKFAMAAGAAPQQIAAPAPEPASEPNANAASEAIA